MITRATISPLIDFLLINCFMWVSVYCVCRYKDEGKAIAVNRGKPEFNKSGKAVDGLLWADQSMTKHCF